MLKVTLLLTVALCTLGLARHIRVHHHGHGVRDSKMYDDAQMPEIDGMSLETLRNIRPNHFVPINNALFFKRYEPCEEGLKRDLFGICREVWD